MIFNSLHESKKSSVNWPIITTDCCDIFVVLDSSEHIMHRFVRDLRIRINHKEVIGLYEVDSVIDRSDFPDIFLVLEVSKSVLFLFSCDNCSRIICTFVIDNIQGYIFLWITGVDRIYCFSDCCCVIVTWNNESQRHIIT